LTVGAEEVLFLDFLKKDEKMLPEERRDGREAVDSMYWP
jgi:hypothetical protein